MRASKSRRSGLPRAHSRWLVALLPQPALTEGSLLLAPRPRARCRRSSRPRWRLHASWLDDLHGCGWLPQTRAHNQVFPGEVFAYYGPCAPSCSRMMAPAPTSSAQPRVSTNGFWEEKCWILLEMTLFIFLPIAFLGVRKYGVFGRKIWETLGDALSN
jgi:hypothetical protein